MAPLLLDRDYVLINHWYRKIKIGNLVVINHPFYHRMIKRVIDISDDGHLWLSGENSQSLRPEQIGWIQRSQIVGKVIFCICANRKQNVFKK